MDVVRLREVVATDIAPFFEQQRDARANHMAAFTGDDPENRPAFVALWMGILANEHIVKRTIVSGDVVVGNVVHFIQYGLPAVGYWIDRSAWGRGIATAALTEFLGIVRERPLYARVAFDNLGSQRVLEKCGFQFFQRERAYAAARDEEIEEYVLILRA